MSFNPTNIFTGSNAHKLDGLLAETDQLMVRTFTVNNSRITLLNINPANQKLIGSIVDDSIERNGGVLPEPWAGLSDGYAPRANGVVVPIYNGRFGPVSDDDWYDFVTNIRKKWSVAAHVMDQNEENPDRIAGGRKSAQEKKEAELYIRETERRQEKQANIDKDVLEKAKNRDREREDKARAENDRLSEERRKHELDRQRAEADHQEAKGREQQAKDENERRREQQAQAEAHAKAEASKALAAEKEKKQREALYEAEKFKAAQTNRNLGHQAALDAAKGMPGVIATVTSTDRQDSQAHMRGATDIEAKSLPHEDRKRFASRISEKLPKGWLVILEEPGPTGQHDTQFREGIMDSRGTYKNDKGKATGIHIHIQPPSIESHSIKLPPIQLH